MHDFVVTEAKTSVWTDFRKERGRETLRWSPQNSSTSSSDSRGEISSLSVVGQLAADLK